jgi:hypothetical protein
MVVATLIRMQRKFTEFPERKANIVTREPVLREPEKQQ